MKIFAEKVDEKIPINQVHVLRFFQRQSVKGIFYLKCKGRKVK